MEDNCLKVSLLVTVVVLAIAILLGYNTFSNQKTGLEKEIALSEERIKREKQHTENLRLVAEKTIEVLEANEKGN